jgi:hypothetical protein
VVEALPKHEAASEKRWRTLRPDWEHTYRVLRRSRPNLTLEDLRAAIARSVSGWWLGKVVKPGDLVRQLDKLLAPEGQPPARASPPPRKPPPDTRPRCHRCNTVAGVAKLDDGLVWCGGCHRNGGEAA